MCEGQLVRGWDFHNRSLPQDNRLNSFKPRYLVRQGSKPKPKLSSNSKIHQGKLSCGSAGSKLYCATKVLLADWGAAMSLQNCSAEV
jgi:hypothetical protein